MQSVEVLTTTYNSLHCISSPGAKDRKMKTTILLFAVIFGCVAPAFSQLNPHHKTDPDSEQFKNKKYYDFGIYSFDKFSNDYVDKFNDFLSKRERNRPAPGNSRSYILRNNSILTVSGSNKTPVPESCQAIEGRTPENGPLPPDENSQS